MLSKQAVEDYLTPLAPLPTQVKPGGELIDDIQCILFDVYGTLFISDAGDIHSTQIESNTAKSMSSLLTRYKIKKDSNRLIQDYLKAISDEHKALTEKGIDVPEVKIDRMWMDITGMSKTSAQNFATEFELIINPVFPMPNLKSLILACRAANLFMGIISNAQFYTAYLFHWFLGSHPKKLGFHPDLIFYSYLTGHAKPSMYMFQKALTKIKELGMSERAVLYVGNDMLNDILPAKKVGFKTAFFAGDLRSMKLRKEVPDCKNLTPDIVVTDLIQLTKYV